MNEMEILQALVGWRCPCCRTVHAPTMRVCLHCSPFLRLAAAAMGDVMDPRMFHDCPAPTRTAVQE